MKLTRYPATYNPIIEYWAAIQPARFALGVVAVVFEKFKDVVGTFRRVVKLGIFRSQLFYNVPVGFLHFQTYGLAA